MHIKEKITTLKNKIKTKVITIKEDITDFKKDINENLEFINSLRNLNSKNYHLQYNIKDNVLRLFDLRKIKNTNIQELKSVFEEIKIIARLNHCKEIRVRTWVFVVHPEIKNKLGFLISEIDGKQKKEKDFKRILGWLSIKKILSEDRKKNLWILQNNGQKKKLPFTSEEFPEYVLRL
ncbi:MAG: hypothetical protein WCX82_01695 [archaeon]|jgi:hypothetical protein